MKQRSSSKLSSAALAVGVLALAGCSQPAPAAPVADDSGCAKPESGIIRPASPGIQSAPLTGPFLVRSLSVGVDPVNPLAFGSLMWSKGEIWFTVHDFKGPLYLAAEESLSAVEGRSPFATIYSGCRLN